MFNAMNDLKEEVTDRFDKFIYNMECMLQERANYNISVWFCLSDGKSIPGMPSIYFNILDEVTATSRQLSFDSSEYFIYPTIQKDANNLLLTQ